MLLTYGSRGSDVSSLQTLLNNSGYGLSVDGIYGSKTQATVRDYQSKNGLSVDGIAGDQTWGKLNSTGTAGTAAGSEAGAAAAGTSAQTPAATPDYSSWYKPSQSVTDYKTALDTAQDNKSGDYSSQYQAQMDALYQKIMNRQPFSYDFSADPLYEQYRKQYTTQGKQAMQDTVGQGAALTGGYDSTYAQSAGQQQYNAYLQKLNDVIPDLYTDAYNRYEQQGTDLQNLYSLASNQEGTDYSRYRDKVTDYNQELSNAQNLYNNERSQDYTVQSAGWNRANDLADTARSQSYTQAENLISAGIMPGDSLLTAAGMDKDYASRMVQAYLDKLAAASSSGSSGGSSGRSSGRSYSSGSGSSSSSSSGSSSTSSKKSAANYTDSEDGTPEVADSPAAQGYWYAMKASQALPGIKNIDNASLDRWLAQYNLSLASIKAVKAQLQSKYGWTQSRR